MTYNINNGGDFILLCCFTGHRKIPEDERFLLRPRLQKTIQGLLNRDITTFYCGGALGFDTLAAQAVLKARRFHPQVKLILALPCRDQAEHWREADRLLYESVKRRADDVVYLSERYTRSCMFERNRYMVDHSDVCVCYCTSDQGGTAYTVQYARCRGVPVINLAEEGWDEKIP